jgi:hypothetical protein
MSFKKSRGSASKVGDGPRIMELRASDLDKVNHVSTDIKLIVRDIILRIEEEIRRRHAEGYQSLVYVPPPQFSVAGITPEEAQEIIHSEVIMELERAGFDVRLSETESGQNIQFHVIFNYREDDETRERRRTLIKSRQLTREDAIRIREGQEIEHLPGARVRRSKKKKQTGLVEPDSD